MNKNLKKILNFLSSLTSLIASTYISSIVADITFEQSVTSSLVFLLCLAGFVEIKKNFR